MSRRAVLTAIGTAGLGSAFAALALAEHPGEPGAVVLFAPFVAVLAFEYGAILGAFAGALATCLFFLDVVLTGDATVTGIVVRGVPMLTLGAATGWLGRRLRESEESYRRMVETAGELIWTVDGRGTTTFVNERARELLGYDPDEMIGRPAASFVQDGQEEVLLGLETPAEHDVALTHKDGGDVWLRVSATPIVDGQGRFAGSLAMGSDITARRRAEEELGRRERALEEAQALAHVGSWEWDIAENRVSWSDELFRIYGLDPMTFQASYEAFVEHVHPDDRQRLNEAVQHAYGTGEPFTLEHRIVRPDGEIRTLEARGRVYRGAGARPQRMAGTGHDITERKRAELALADARAELARHDLGRRQAQDLNDTVVQALVVAKYSLEREQPAVAARALETALAQARTMITDLLGDGEVQPGQLRRDAPAGIGSGHEPE